MKQEKNDYNSKQNSILDKKLFQNCYLKGSLYLTFIAKMKREGGI